MITAEDDDDDMAAAAAVACESSSECVYCNAIRPPKECPQMTEGLFSCPCRPRCDSVSMTSCTQDCMSCGRAKKKLLLAVVAVVLLEWEVDEEPPWPRTSRRSAS